MDGRTQIIIEFFSIQTKIHKKCLHTKMIYWIVELSFKGSIEFSRLTELKWDEECFFLYYYFKLYIKAHTMKSHIVVKWLIIETRDTQNSIITWALITVSQSLQHNFLYVFIFHLLHTHTLASFNFYHDYTNKKKRKNTSLTWF